MAIKRIPIKGISRDPSGQISAEGMCAESFNVQLDMGEVAPMMKPKPVTEFGDIVVNGDALYIHKGIGYENLICLEGQQLCAYKKNGAGRLTLFTYSGNVTILSITHVGNTLIVSEDVDRERNMRYFLYKDGYTHLGTKIPVPNVWFGTKQTNTGGAGSGLRVDASCIYPYRHEGTEHTPSYWVSDIDALQTKISPGTLVEDDWSTKANDYIPENEDALEVVERIWGAIDEEYKKKCANGEALFPIFVRFALRLYDGSLYGCSVPLLLGGDIEKMTDVKLTSRWQDETYTTPEGRVLHYWRIYANVGLPKPFIVMADYSDANLASTFEGWEDIVKSIDIFFSDQMFPAKRRNSLQLTNRDVYEKEAETEDWRGVHADGIIDPNYTEKDCILDHVETYLVKSIKLEEFGDYTGVVVMDDINLSADSIINHEALGESYLSHHQWISDNITNYNNSLLLGGVMLRMSNGHPYHVSTRWVAEELNRSELVYVFHLRVNGQICYVYSRNPSRTSRVISGKASDVSVYPYNSTYYERVTAWLAYPDSRCFRVDVLSYDSVRDEYSLLGSQTMEALSTQDVAYAFAGFGKTPYSSSVQPDQTPPRYTKEEIGEAVLPNVLIQSKSSNPFVTTASGVVTLSGDVINIGIVTTPLSEGQFGQFPLYVFTTEGVFALSVDGLGNFTTNHSVTREQLLNRNSLIGIEQGIFFVSARGLMLLQGSSVTKVSDLMDGKPDAVSGALAQQIAETYFSGASVGDNQPFYQFLNGCKMAYDYANSRIVLFREGQSDMYVYKFNTQSWHRMGWNPQSTPVRALNSYPEAFIVEKNAENKQVLMNYSVLAEEPDAEPLPGLVYTRELSLDEQDLYKTINRLKVRGRYADGHVKWALQGSNDGVNYRTLHSLRGPSWKWYRIAIVTMLDAQERISYIELDYTPKFTNRLR